MASSTVGTAVIKLSFDGSDVKAELSRTSNQFKDAGEKAGSQFGSAMTVALGSLISKGVSKIIGAITDNLDSAINRVDVINNFPRLMESLGFSTDEASASIKAISDRLDGLPSTLNGVVGDVQKLAATMGNLNTGMVNATSLGLALNDMFLAGGKGTEAASNAMEQYNQMLAQGKPDMQSWRSILNAAPGQLKQLARALLGATANQNDLYEALQKGNVSFDQLNEAIVRLDKEGGDGFDSFERQARNATGGVGTALENVQNRISKAIAKVIDVIGADNIANAINDISSHFGEVGEAVGRFVKFSMEQIGEFSRFIGNNMWIVDTIKGALASIIAMEIGFKIMELKDKVVKLFSVLAAHPLLALASAIIGVTTAILSATQRETELSAAIKKTTEGYKDARESLDRIHKSRQDMLDQGMSELDYYDTLARELDQITDENGKVKNGYEDRARFITTKLSEALGTEINLNNGVIENYKEIRSQIDQTIKKKQAELQLKAQEEAYTEAIKKRAEVSKRIVAAEEEIKQAMESGRNLFDIPRLMEQMEEEKRLYREYSADISGYLNTYAAYTEGRLDDINTAYWTNTYEIAKSGNATTEELERASREIDVQLELIEQNVDLMGEETYRTTKEKLLKMKGEVSSQLNGMRSNFSSSMVSTRNTVTGSMASLVNETVRIARGFKTAGQTGGDSMASGFNSKSGTVSNSVNNVVNNARNGAWNNSYNSGWGLGNRVGNAMADGISSSAWRAVEQANAFMDRIRSITNVNIPGPQIEGTRQIYNFATGRYEYTAMASGGYVDGATQALVGEAGQEVVLPLQNNTNNWSGLLASAIMEQMDMEQRPSTINVYMNNTIDNDMSIDELGRKFSQSIRRYA